MRDSGTGTVGRKVKAILFVGVIVALLVVLVVAWLGKENPQAITAIEDLVHRYGLTGVFASTVIAGSIVPFGSPIIVACAAGFGLDIPVLVLTASTGYTLGVLTSYIPAYVLGERYVKRKMGEEAFQQYVESWNRRGYKLCVLFSLIPGFPVDLLALVCGCFHTRAKLFIPLCWITISIQFAICAWLGGVLAHGFLHFSR